MRTTPDLAMECWFRSLAGTVECTQAVYSWQTQTVIDISVTYATHLSRMVHVLGHSRQLQYRAVQHTMRLGNCEQHLRQHVLVIAR